MITKFEIENFKSFAAKQELKLAPITLVYGPNSSGKSSIIQALIMLQQTLQSKDKHSDLITSGNKISLGSFETLIHKHNSNSSMKFSLEYNSNFNSDTFRVDNGYTMPIGNPAIRKLDLSYKEVSGKPTLLNYSFSHTSKSQSHIGYSVVRKREGESGPSFSIENLDEFKNKIPGVSKIATVMKSGPIDQTPEFSSIFKTSAKLNLPSSFADNGSILRLYIDKMIDDIAFLFDDIKYLGPLRSPPKRFYTNTVSNYEKGQGKHNLGYEIHNASNDVKETINNFLKQFNIPYTITTKNHGTPYTGEIVTILLEDLRNGAVITPKDVGFGIGQVLPIVLEAIMSSNKLICVEQPEIHLHPRLQAHLADLFIESISKKSNNQWIIETHSEALMLRIQKRIREGKIIKENVSVLYVDVGESGAQVTPISLNDNGDFTTAWPDGFFEDRLDEIFGV